MDGYGNISWWGFSPALNLIDYLPSREINNDKGDTHSEVNILLVNNHDPRNIINTLCNLCDPKNQSQSRTKINFYVLEPFVEQVGRYMLLLNVILDASFGLQEKIETFLELYGNSLLRNPTAEYVSQQSAKFIEAVTDLDQCKELFPIYDLSILKHKERDYLEGTLKFWRSTDNHNFQIHKMWDYRNREYLGPRYDVKENTFDWDRIMRLVERGAKVIHKEEYESFRSKGVAFESRSGDYNVPNRTTSSPIVVTDARADRVMKRGYFGDIVTGPFIGFGIETENEDLYKKANNMYIHNSLDVATHNLQELLKKLKCHKKIIEEANLTEVDEENETESDTLLTDDFSNVSVKFIYGKDMKYFLTKEKFKNSFDLVHVASDGASFLDESLTNILKQKSTVLVESPKYIIDLKPEQVASILQTLKKRGEDFGFNYFGFSDFEQKPFEVNVLHFLKSI
ncbi:dynein axonemal assembly factor 3-like [Symsagittifera roscoffensis]|uniref:dynein axonemal assembly factor 3-like n=1 Tax=Symsagittifera roscoffensis TaxID=84072 RepID=UPI00307B737A